MVNDAFYSAMHFIWWNVLFDDVFYLMMRFIFLSYDALYFYLFKALFIQGFIYSRLYLIQGFI